MPFLTFLRELFTFTAMLCTLFVWTFLGYAVGL